MYVNNHTGVWGSWYDPASGEWGYACCHSIVHLSYCTGEAGKEAAQASSARALLASSASAPAPERPAAPAEATDDRKKKAEELFSKKRLGEGELSLDRERLADAIAEERKRKARGEDGDDRLGKRQKGVSGASAEVTQEELGAFLSTFTLYGYGMLMPLFDSRGVPNEPPDDRGPDGQLRRHGAVTDILLYFCANIMSCFVRVSYIRLFVMGYFLDLIDCRYEPTR